MWQLSIILTNSATNNQLNNQPTALCAQMHLLPFTYTSKVGMVYLVLQSVFTTTSPSLTGTSEGHYKTNIDFSSFFCASETPKLGTAFCRSYMCGHHALQPRSLPKAHAVKSGPQRRNVQLSPVFGNVAFPSSDNDSCKSSSSRERLLCTKCCHYL